MGQPALAEALDPSTYWEAAAKTVELYAIPSDVVTDSDRAEFAANIAVIDETTQRVRAGATSGRAILDRLIASGQVMTPPELDQLEATEAMLEIDDPVLLQQGFDWKLGIVSAKELYFSPVRNRASFFRAAARGYQAIPVMSYLELQLGCGAIFSPEYESSKVMDVRSIEPGWLPPEAGRGIGMPLDKHEVGRYPFRGEHRAPESLIEAWRVYEAAFAYRDRNGWLQRHDMIHVGKLAVEENLGIPLDELLNYVDNASILEYVTRPNTEADTEI